jgi:hypothetical protein
MSDEGIVIDGYKVLREYTDEHIRSHYSPHSDLGKVMHALLEIPPEWRQSVWSDGYIRYDRRYASGEVNISSLFRYTGPRKWIIETVSKFLNEGYRPERMETKVEKIEGDDND